MAASLHMRTRQVVARCTLCARAGGAIAGIVVGVVGGVAVLAGAAAVVLRRRRRRGGDSSETQRLNKQLSGNKHHRGGGDAKASTSGAWAVRAWRRARGLVGSVRRRAVTLRAFVQFAPVCVCVVFASVWIPRRGRSPATGHIRCPAAQGQASQSILTGAGTRSNPPPECVTPRRLDAAAVPFMIQMRGGCFSACGPRCCCAGAGGTDSREGGTPNIGTQRDGGASTSSPGDRTGSPTGAADTTQRATKGPVHVHGFIYGVRGVGRMGLACLSVASLTFPLGSRGFALSCALRAVRALCCPQDPFLRTTAIQYTWTDVPPGTPLQGAPSARAPTPLCAERSKAWRCGGPRLCTTAYRRLACPLRCEASDAPCSWAVATPPRCPNRFKSHHTRRR